VLNKDVYYTFLLTAKKGHGESYETEPDGCSIITRAEWPKSNTVNNYQ